MIITMIASQRCLIMEIFFFFNAKCKCDLTAGRSMHRYGQHRSKSATDSKQYAPSQCSTDLYRSGSEVCLKAIKYIHLKTVKLMFALFTAA